MLRVRIELEPHGDKNESRQSAEITIANITRAAGRVSSDYAWRIQTVNDHVKEPIAHGCLVDSYNANAVDLLWEVLREWKSGRSMPLDNHGNVVSPILDHRAFWAKADPDL